MIYSSLHLSLAPLRASSVGALTVALPLSLRPTCMCGTIMCMRLSYGALSYGARRPLPPRRAVACMDLTSPSLPQGALASPHMPCRTGIIMACVASRRTLGASAHISAAGSEGLASLAAAPARDFAALAIGLLVAHLTTAHHDRLVPSETLVQRGEGEGEVTSTGRLRL